MAHLLGQLCLQSVVDRRIPEKCGWQAAPTLIDRCSGAAPRTIITVTAGEIHACSSVIARVVPSSIDVLRNHAVDVIDLSGAMNSVRTHVTNQQCSAGCDFTLHAEVVLNYVSTFWRSIDKGHAAS